MLNDLSALDVCLLAGTFALIWNNLRPRTTSQPPTIAPAPLEQLSPTQLSEFVTRLATLETTVQGLPSLWETERQRVEEQADLARRSAARIEQANRRAEALRTRGDELELGGSASEWTGPVAPSLSLSHGAGGREGFVPPLPAHVAPTPGLPPHKQRG